MTQEIKETTREWLARLATTNMSEASDEAAMTNFLRGVGFSSACVVGGIVYLEGRGTVDAPPVDIHTLAGMLNRV